MVVKTTPAPQALDETPVQALKGVGEAMALKLATLGIFTLQDVLFHLPFRYQDRTRLSKIILNPVYVRLLPHSIKAKLSNLISYY